ncbi:MAG: hypothetical protein J6S85_10295 [Methanobrevibacter sp.]|nr:hypothetical protein [Methanobrevibacter sp.]
MNPLISMYRAMMQNPNQFMQNMANNNQILGNPMARNVLQMMQNGDSKGLEEMARNLCKERGMDADKVLQQFKNQLGI